MNRRSRSYARAARRRAIAAVLSLSTAAVTFLVPFFLSEATRREADQLAQQLRLPRPPQSTLNPDETTERPVSVSGKVHAPSSGRSRYRLASDVNARLAASGLVVERFLPAAAADPGTANSPPRGFRYEIVGSPSPLLAFLRSLCEQPSPYTVEPLRLWVQGGSLHADLTVRYPSNEPE